jgi:glycosyltransferase involved in cell wall biosynthesis
MINEATLLLPTHNEEDIIGVGLKSIYEQKLTTYKLKVLVIPNGCTDNTTQVIQDFIKEHQAKENLTWEIINLERGNRTDALNAGLLKAKTEYVILLNPDCTLESNAVETVLDSLNANNEVNVVGLMCRPDFKLLDQKSLLCKMQKAFVFYRETLKNVLPWGRFLAYRKSCFSQFPKGIFSDDVWLCLTSYDKFGEKSVVLLDTPAVTYISPKKWLDYIKTEARYLEAMRQLYSIFPNLKLIDQKRKAKFNVSDEEAKVLFHDFCVRENVDHRFISGIKYTFIPMLVEYSIENKQISDEGNWELIK